MDTTERQRLADELGEVLVLLAKPRLTRTERQFVSFRVSQVQRELEPTTPTGVPIRNFLRRSAK